MPASEIFFIVVVIGLLGGLFVALRAPTRFVADARTRADKMAVASVGAIIASGVLGLARQPALGVGTAAVAAGSAALGLYLTRCADSGDDGGEPRHPDSPDPGDDGDAGGPEWDSFDRERAGWERPVGVR
ncbi:MAG TPA: hypothetical protein VHX88_04250 [Solirubrobacteraceae bacterium]|jgi:hypothetical protein|nr:hypothetical protein [Solirubrobacteraceae bacterium]